MASINIEECWWIDPRRSKLSKLLGSENLADGLSIRVWRLAQEFWKNNKEHVPLHIFEALENSKHFLESGLAELRDDYIYVRGSSKYGQHIDFIREKKENGSKGGKKSAQRQRNSKGQLLKKSENIQADSKHYPSNIQADSKHYPSNIQADSKHYPSNIQADSKQHRLIEIWNEHCGELSKVMKTNKERERKIKAVFGDIVESEWIEVVKKLSNSSFCNGKNDSGWKANFDFLVKPGTNVKVLEGNYDNRDVIKNGMLPDGRYLTPALKRSHNSKIMIEKYLKTEDQKDDEQIRDVSTDSFNC